MRQVGPSEGGSVSYKTLIAYLKDAHKALEEEKDVDAAFRFEMLIDYLSTEYNPSEPLKFKFKHLGL